MGHSNKYRDKAHVKAWLRTPSGQTWLESKIAEKNVGKSERRKLAATAEMKRRGLQADCGKCLRGRGRHCSWNLPDGCLDYLEVGTGRELRVYTKKDQAA